MKYFLKKWIEIIVSPVNLLLLGGTTSIIAIVINGWSAPNLRNAVIEDMQELANIDRFLTYTDHILLQANLDGVGSTIIEDLSHMCRLEVLSDKNEECEKILFDSKHYLINAARNINYTIYNKSDDLDKWAVLDYLDEQKFSKNVVMIAENIKSINEENYNRIRSEKIILRRKILERKEINDKYANRLSFFGFILQSLGVLFIFLKDIKTYKTGGDFQSIE